MRKKLTVLLVVLAAGVFAVAAWAATPQGTLGGHSGENTTDGVIEKISTDTDAGLIKDGQTDPLYIGKNNDRSGNCTGDTGTVFVKYKVGPNTHGVPIICAHWLAGDGTACTTASRTGCQSMVFDFQDPIRDNTWVVIRAVLSGRNGAHDFTRAAIYPTAALAQAVVNLGVAPPGQPLLTQVDDKAQWVVVAAQ